MNLSLITFLYGGVKNLPVALKMHIYISLSSFFIEVKLTHAVTVVSSVQHSDLTSLYVTLLCCVHKCSYCLSGYIILTMSLTVFPLGAFHSHNLFFQ